MSDQPKLEELMTAARLGTGVARDAAERALCLALAPRIRLYALRHLRDEAAAADLVQEALLVVLEATRAGRVSEPEHVDRFVLGTCRNLVARARRGETRGRSFERAVLPLAASDMPPAFTRLDAARLALCLGTIDARSQRIIVMTFQEERTTEEIATALATSPGNVRVLRHRTLAALQRCVGGVA